MRKQYDSSWDVEENEEGTLPGNEDAFNRMYAAWEKRLWEPWLREKLKFPFQVERMEDEDDAYFSNIAQSQPFRLGHVMEVIDIEREDDHYGIIVKVKEANRVGHVPLCDVEVTEKENENF